MLVRGVANDLMQRGMVRVIGQLSQRKWKDSMLQIVEDYLQQAWQRTETSNLAPEEGEIGRRNLHDASPQSVAGMSGSAAAQADRPVCDRDTQTACKWYLLMYCHVRGSKAEAASDARESIALHNSRVMVDGTSQSSRLLQAVCRAAWIYYPSVKVQAALSGVEDASMTPERSDKDRRDPHWMPSHKEPTPGTGALSHGSRAARVDAPLTD